MSTIDSINEVREILKLSKGEGITFTERLGFKCLQFICEFESMYFRESFTKQFKGIREVTWDIRPRGNVGIITVQFECAHIRLEDKYSQDEINSKIKSIKRAKPVAQAPVKRKFPKYIPGMSMNSYCAKYERLNNNALNLLPLESEMTHATTLYEGGKTDFDVVFETVEDI